MIKVIILEENLVAFQATNFARVSHIRRANRGQYAGSCGLAETAGKEDCPVTCKL